VMITALRCIETVSPQRPAGAAWSGHCRGPRPG
jgi:hypothetical protein